MRTTSAALEISSSPKRCGGDTKRGHLPVSAVEVKRQASRRGPCPSPQETIRLFSMSKHSPQLPLLETPPFLHAPARAPRARSARHPPATSLSLPFSAKAPTSGSDDTTSSTWLKKRTDATLDGPPVERHFVWGRARPEAEQRRLESALERALGEGRRRGKELLIRDAPAALTLRVDGTVVTARFSGPCAIDRWAGSLLEVMREFGLAEPE